MHYTELFTPCFLIDKAALERNLDGMIRRATDAGVNLRPHCKTHKCADIARLQTRGQTGGVTVATLDEAEHMADNGFTDITYAVCIVPDKLPRAQRLMEHGITLNILTDDARIAAAIADAAKNSANPFRVLIKIDSGYHRSGIKPESDALLEVGHALHEAKNVNFLGVLTHAGHSYHAGNADEIKRIAEEERAAIVRAAERLEAAGVPCPVRSIGSTPTMLLADNFEGVTEIRPGVYAFMDLMMVTLGVCESSDIAATVLASVIDHQPDHGHIITDAGALALSQDTGVRTGNATAPHLGLVLGDEALGVFAVSQEHGWVKPLNGDPLDFERYPIGSKLRVVPNHACHTAGMHERYHVLDANGNVETEWTSARGW